MSRTAAGEHALAEATEAEHLAPPTVEAVRRWFPGLAGDEILLDNAGGSQLPRSVIEAIAGYLRNAYVQTGAGYRRSRQAGEVVEAAHAWIERLLGGEGVGRAILGASTTQLCHLLAGCHRRLLRPGDEIVLAECGHEANIGPWLALAEDGAVIRWWRAEDDPTGCPLQALDPLLCPRTKLVCFPHVSNLLGAVVDVAEVTRRAHAAGAKVVVDGVAFAPHRPMDVAAWGCDWYVYSTYKVYGPHMGALFGRHEALAELPSPNHFFIPKERTAYRFELGGVSHEGCAGLLGLRAYLAILAGESSPEGASRSPEELFDPQRGDVARPTVVRAFEHMAELEMPLQRHLVDGLRAIPGLRIVGPDSWGPERVATASVVHSSVPSRAMVAEAHRRGVGIRHGHAYAHRLVEALGLDPEDGVVRLSAVHYSTIEEVDQALLSIRAAVAAA